MTWSLLIYTVSSSDLAVKLKLAWQELVNIFECLYNLNYKQDQRFKVQPISYQFHHHH